MCVRDSIGLIRTYMQYTHMQVVYENGAVLSGEGTYTGDIGYGDSRWQLGGQPEGVRASSVLCE